MAKTEITLGLTKIISAVIISVLVGAVGGVVSVLRIANTDHFTIIANDKRISKLEANIVPRSEYDLQYKHLSDELETVNSKLDRLLLR